MRCVVCAVVLFFSAVSTEYSLPVVQINLDAPAFDRWTDLTEMMLINFEWEKTFGPLFDHVNSTVFSGFPPGTYELVGNSVRENWPEYAEELNGILSSFHKYNHTEISFDFLACWAYYHTLGHADFGNGSAFSRLAKEGSMRECTGVLVVDSDGEVLHGRNMDNTPSDPLRTLSVRLQFMQGGQIVAQAADWYWSGGGFMTAFMPGVISLEENWRMDYHDVNATAILNAIQNGAIAQGWMFREALFTRKLTSFQGFVNFLSNVPNPSPMYLILAGAKPWEAAVITRDAIQPPVILSLNSSRPDQWYLVETNYDAWNPDPIDDNRRTIAENALASLGQAKGSTVSGLASVMNIHPVLNDDTVFTAVMHPSSGKWSITGQGGSSP